MKTRLESVRGLLNPTEWLARVFVLTMSVAAAAVPSATPSAREQGPDAEAILSRMAEFLSKTPQMSVTVHGAYDAVQQDGSKVEWNEIRKVTLSRPDRLRIDSERSDGARSLILFDGKNITTFDESGQVYAQAPQSGGVDETVIHFVRDMHMRLPLAVLLLSRLPEELQNRVRTVNYVEKTTTLGAPCASHCGDNGHYGLPIVDRRRGQAPALARRTDI
jgi:hypothetical protein